MPHCPVLAKSCLRLSLRLRASNIQPIKPEQNERAGQKLVRRMYGYNHEKIERSLQAGPLIFY